MTSIPIAQEKIDKLTKEEIESFTTGEYYLDDLLVYSAEYRMDAPKSWVSLRDYQGIYYIKIVDSPIYRSLQKGAYSEYNQYIGKRKNEPVKKLLEIVESIKKEYDETRLIFINKRIQNETGYNIVNDGHHRISVMRHIYGNIKIKVGEILKK